MITDDDDLYQTPAEYYVQECFELAKKALGRTSPNPVVGAIVLDKNGKPIGKGYHQKAGSEHAEVIAIKEAGELSKGGTLIINLEPCSHFGKTPPCTNLIIKSQINEVIFSNYDPNPLVFKKSEKILLENNIKVIPNVLEAEGKELNKFFFKWIKTTLPWISLKQAQTLDGKIALGNGEKRWITSEQSRKEVHLLRNTFDAVLVGANTVQIDNPQLTVRNIENGRNPIRIILDSKLMTDPTSKVYENNAQTILVTKTGVTKNKINQYKEKNPNLDVIELDEKSKGHLDLRELFIVLGKKKILSVLVEAGPNLAGELIANNLIDEYILFLAPKVFIDTALMSGLKIELQDFKAKSFEFTFFDHKIIGNDLMVILRPRGDIQ